MVLGNYFLFVIFTFLFSSFLQGEESPCSSKGIAREKTLLHLEEMLNWVFPFSSRTFALEEGKRAKVFQRCEREEESLKQFAQRYGYFSCYRPLIGVVTEEEGDIDCVQEVLIKMLADEKDVNWAEIASGEILTKALAYRNLQPGRRVRIPWIEQDQVHFINYQVEQVFDLWQGMPAFGLVPMEGKASPLLLFRGTDFSLVSKSSWASVICDLDWTGTGLSAFQAAEKQIQSWLQTVCAFHGKARVLGFSLGGVLAMYTAIFQGKYLEKCLAFNAPGVSKAVFEIWEKQSEIPPIISYVTQGDLVPKFGRMIGTAFELSDKKPMGPIEAHTKIMSAQNSLLLFPIHLNRENQNRLTAPLQR